MVPGRHAHGRYLAKRALGPRECGVRRANTADTDYERVNVNAKRASDYTSNSWTNSISNTAATAPP